MPSGNLGNVDCVATEVEEMLGNQCEATVLHDFVFRVNPIAAVGSAILGKRDFVIDSHRIDQLTVTGTFAEVGPACPGDPVASAAISTMLRFLEPYLHFANVQIPPNGFGANPRS